MLSSAAGGYGVLLTPICNLEKAKDSWAIHEAHDMLNFHAADDIQGYTKQKKCHMLSACEWN